MPIHFGTDGWRAVISEDFTFANVRKVAQAIADMARDRGSGIGDQKSHPSSQSPIPSL